MNNVKRQVKEIDDSINHIKKSGEIAKNEIIKITNNRITILQLIKMDIVYKEYKLNRLVNFCNTGKFEY